VCYDFPNSRVYKAQRKNGTEPAGKINNVTIKESRLQVSSAAFFIETLVREYRLTQRKVETE
jgi:hypothetical protein